MSHTHDYKKQHIPLAKHLRKTMTPEERTLWYHCLSLLPVRAHRQKCIGKYIVDFYIPSIKTVIELDGSQHEQYENATDDLLRDSFLYKQGITVVRYKNTQINDNFRGVVKDILTRLDLDNEETREEMQKKYRERNGYKN